MTLVNTDDKKEVCCVCGKPATDACGNCDTPYCDEHYKTTVMTGNCCRLNEIEYEKEECYVYDW